MTTRLSGSSGKGGPSHTPPHEGDRPGIGELLRRARTGRGLTLEQIANETRIPQSHLEALEHDNLAVVPAGFYRRAEIRAYARAVNLDQNLALTELDRAEAAPDTPRRQELIFSRKRVLIVVAVAVAAAVFGRARGGREPAAPGAIDSPQHSVPPVQEAPPDAVVETSPRIQLDHVPPVSASSDGALALPTEPTGRASAASNGDLAATTERAEAPVSADSVTELLVTTEPPGARVTVNGIGWGTTPVTIRHLPAGDKRIRVSKEGYASEERIIRLVESRQGTLDIQLRSAP